MKQNFWDSTMGWVMNAVRSVFPPPRDVVRPSMLLPLIVFYVLFIGGCGVAVLGDWVMFTWLGAFGFLAIGVWVWWMDVCGYSGLRGWRRTAALWVRLCLLGMFVIVLAEPRMVRKDDSLAVVFVMDQSQSIGSEAQDNARQFMAKVAAGKPSRDDVGVVTFGGEAVVELAPSKIFPYEEGSVEYALQVRRDGTDLEKALSLAGAMLPGDKPGRIVLISDGVSTQGAYGDQLEELAGKKIPVDVLTVDYDYEKEVLIERLELPRAEMVKVGDTYKAVGIVWAANDGEGELTLLENGSVIAQEKVQYQKGKNRFEMPIYMRQAGYYEYSLSIQTAASEDSILQNNKAVSYLYLQGEGRTLLVVEPGGTQDDWVHIKRALEESERDVDVMNAFAFPDDPLALMPYDCVMFVNVGAEHFGEMRMSALKQAVNEYGVGFVMVGGQNSYGPGGYHRTTIEEILPVSMDVTQRKVLPKAALAIILHTCEFADGNTWGVRITKQAIKVLGGQDEVGVLVFDWEGGERWLFHLTPARNYPMLAKQLNGAQIGDMPSFAPTMRMALQGLKKSDASMKHMIIISDGDPSPAPKALLGQFVANKISVSTVAVFPHGTTTQEMKRIARVTGGRFYEPSDPNTLPSIFVKEAKTLRRSMIQEKTFVPEVSFPSPILDGIDTMPPLHGYTIVTPKPTSTVILDVPAKEDREPLLSTWRYGLGKTSAFTSDLSPRWANDWMEWAQYKAFVHQLVTDVARVKSQSQLRMQVMSNGGRGLILVEDYSTDGGFMELEADIDGPGENERIELTQVGPRRYEASFDLRGEGRYRVTVAGDRGGEIEKSFGGLMVAYSQEYKRLRANPIAMKEIAANTGGRELKGDEKASAIFDTEREAKRRSRPVFDWFLIVLACLVPLDVAFRRVQLDWTVVRGWIGLGREREVSRETFSTLLSRKKDVGALLSGDDEMLKARAAQKDLREVDEQGAKRVLESVGVGTEKQDEVDGPAGGETMSKLKARRQALREQQDNEG
ncbi:glutamine amidotransferase [Poriferisphaera sp. WC338]|uniref:glutamine amidotransferase n=1 Tax=Poriferisphaera sp. WC338 TaxID=3425129 RepID=UPI003D816993